MSKRWLVAMAAFWAASGALRAENAPPPADPASPGAGLVCEQPVLDFGEAPSGATVTNLFRLRNAGTNTVSIRNVRPTCGCTTVGLSTNRVEPGAVVELTTALSLAGRRGYQRKAVYVESDDQQQPRLRLELRGLATVDIMVQPEGVHFGTVGREGLLRQEVLLTARSNVTFAIQSVDTGSPAFTAEVEEREPGTSYVVRVMSAGPRMPGTSVATVRVVTDLPSTPTLTIPVAAFVAADVVAVPSQLILVPSATNGTRTANLTVYSPSGKPFTVRSVEWPSPSVTGTVAAASGGRVRIEVSSRGGLEDAEGKAIRIVTDLLPAADVWVPLRIIRPAGP